MKRSDNLNVTINIANLTINDSGASKKPNKLVIRVLKVVGIIAALAVALLAVFFINPELCVDLVCALIDAVLG